MANLVRLRLALDDRPGVLARIAAVVAGHGGNIVSVDVHRPDGAGGVVDDLVVDFPPQPDLGRLREELAADGTATLLSHQDAHHVDPVVAVLRRVADLLVADAVDADDALAAAVAELCESPAVWVSSPAEAAVWEVGRFALERGGAFSLRSSDLPPALAERIPGEVWLLAVPDPERRARGRVVFVARPMAHEFTSTEVARIESLMALHDRIEGLLRSDT